MKDAKQLPEGVTEENWHRPSKKARIEPQSLVIVNRYSIPGTQFTVNNGNAACTAISFVAACRMAGKQSLEDVQSKIKWLDVLEKGASLWKTWRVEFKDKPGNFVSLWDIRRLPQITKWTHLNRVLSATIEMAGSLADRVNANMNVPNNKSVYNLSEALHSMETMGPAVSVLTVKDISLSIWHRSGCWAMYDSHGGGSILDSSSLVLVEGDGPKTGAVAMEKILRARFKRTRGRSGKGAATYYISIMRADKVAACKPKNRNNGE